MYNDFSTYFLNEWHQNSLVVTRVFQIILFDLNDNINITDLIAPLAPVYKNKKVDFILFYTHDKHKMRIYVIYTCKNVMYQY